MTPDTPTPAPATAADAKTLRDVAVYLGTRAGNFTPGSEGRRWLEGAAAQCRVLADRLDAERLPDGVRVISLYQCVVCRERSIDRAAIVRCAAKGNPVFPVGLIRCEDDRYRGGSRQASAIVGGESSCHHFYASEVECMTWKFAPPTQGELKPIRRCDPYRPFPLTDDQRRCDTTLRLVQWLESRGIVPLVWDAAANAAVRYSPLPPGAAGAATAEGE